MPNGTYRGTNMNKGNLVLIGGFKGAAKRIDTIATAITGGLTTQLVDLDPAYAPPFSTVWDPVQIVSRRFI
ncbi:MAG: hypothetical protein K9G58_12815 [Bacteroidales bacterium]|nr:hypothetical protein [Bacteroidales bacterium]